MRCDIDRAVNPRMRDWIRTCAACGRLIKEAYASAAQPGGSPADWLDQWLEHTKDYRHYRMLVLMIFSEDIAAVARQVGIDCDADRVLDAPFDVAIEIDDVLNGNLRGSQSLKQTDA